MTNLKTHNILIVLLYGFATTFLLSCATKQSIQVTPLPLDTIKTNSKLNEHQSLALKGLTDLSNGNIDEASGNFNDALRLNPANSNYHLLNAVTYHLEALSGSSASYDLAIQGYQAAQKFDPTSWLPFYFLGRLYVEKNEFSLARQQFASALILEDDEPDLLKAMAFASYRAGDATVAVAMIDKLERAGALTDVSDFQNAALIYASVGEVAKSEQYFRKLEYNNEKAWKTKSIKRRIDDWQSLHDRVESAQKVQWGAPSNNAWGSSISTPQPASTNPGAGGSSDNKKMVVVDVVIIRTEESNGTSKGINLLNGLKVQFGNTGGSAFSDSESQSRTTTTNISDSQPSTASISGTVTDTITKSVSIPALDYSLNIFNAAGNRNEILARPTIVAMAGKKSEFFSGVELNAAAVSGGISGQPVQIQKEIGVKLAVTPSFTDDGRVEMSVQAERTFLNTPNSDVNFTFRIETSKTNVNANVIMRYGETLILSGLSEKDFENSRSGVPFLQDIPLIQYFFSEHQTLEFQRSVIILLTPRPAQYVYQTESARQEFEKSLSEDERPIANLRARYSDWFKPYPNWASVFNHMQNNGFYSEFRTGDVELESWNSNKTLANRLKQSLAFLWF